MPVKLADLNEDGMKSLKKGDEVLSVSFRSRDFVSRHFDHAILLPLAGSDFVISALEVGYDSVGFKLSVEENLPGHLSLTGGETVQRQILTENVQLRASAETCVALAAVILEHARKHAPDAIKTQKDMIANILKEIG